MFVFINCITEKTAFLVLNGYYFCLIVVHSFSKENKNKKETNVKLLLTLILNVSSGHVCFASNLFTMATINFSSAVEDI